MRARTSLSLMTSSGPTSSSILSMTMPSSEYSRILETSSRLADLWGPLMTKAMILRSSGSMMALPTYPIAAEACILSIGVPISLFW